MKNIVVFIFASFYVLLSSSVSAQEEDVLRKALKDELERNIQNLDHPEYEKPFYISYQVNDFTNTSISATLGGILNSNVARQRTVNGRVLAGDYDFNDESFASQNVEPYYGPDDSQLPLEDDYYGIRRALWNMTDKIYKTAGEILESHKKTLANKSKKIGDTPHLLFSKELPIQKTVNSTLELVPRSFLENKMEEFSSEFLRYPAIEISGVNLNFYRGNDYFISSEGSDFKEAKALLAIYVTAATQDETGSYAFSQSSYISDDSKSLLTSIDFTKEVDKIAAELETIRKAPKFDDSYEGPVLFMSEAIPALFRNILYQFTPDQSVANELNDFNVDYGYESTYESRIGKVDFHKALTIKLKPSLTVFEGEKLLGAYQLDREGMIPKDEITLVQNGMIKELMVGRNYTSEKLKPNGTASGLGVVQITFDEIKKKEGALKQMLLKEVKKKKLDYGLMVKKMNGNQQVNIYKVYPDGSEELYRWARIADVDKKSLRKIMAATSSKTVLNIPGQNGVTSYITPSAMLINDIDVEPMRMPVMNLEESLVPSPLSLIKAKD